MLTREQLQSKLVSELRKTARPITKMGNLVIQLSKQELIDLILKKQGGQKTMQTLYFAAVRKNQDHEFVDIGTINPSHLETQRLADQMDAKIPNWAKDNPVERIASFEIKELEVYDLKMRMSEFSRMVGGVSPHTIRAWEKQGRFQFKRNWNGERIFTEQDVNAVKDFISRKREKDNPVE